MLNSVYARRQIYILIIQQNITKNENTPSLSFLLFEEMNKTKKTAKCFKIFESRFPVL